MESRAVKSVSGPVRVELAMSVFRFMQVTEIRPRSGHSFLPDESEDEDEDEDDDENANENEAFLPFLRSVIEVGNRIRVVVPLKSAVLTG